MSMANDNGEKIQAIPLGRGFGKVASTYTVQPSDRVFQPVADGNVTVAFKDGTTVSGAVGAFVGYGIVRGTVSIQCDVDFHIG